MSAAAFKRIRMNKVERAEILALGPYEQIRERFRDRVIALKRHRRVNLGAHMSLVFENHDTMLLQVQEILRTERISDESGIAHEIATYNELIPEPGALSATMFIEYEDEAERTRMLVRFASLRQHIHLEFGSERVTARFGTHFGEESDRIPAVNYLTFNVPKSATAMLRDSSASIVLVADHPDYAVSLELPPALREQLARDLDA